jgi:hypothetical protein
MKWGITPLCSTHAELLSALLNVMAEYVKSFADQLEYFSYAEGIMTMKNKKIQQLTRVLRRYIKKGPIPKPKSLRL